MIQNLLKGGTGVHTLEVPTEGGKQAMNIFFTEVFSASFSQFRLLKAEPFKRYFARVELNRYRR